MIWIGKVKKITSHVTKFVGNNPTNEVALSAILLNGTCEFHKLSNAYPQKIARNVVH
jgi:hypothetical protein